MKFSKETVAGGLYDLTTILCHGRINDFESITPESGKSTNFISLHEPGKPHHVRCKDGSESTLW